MAKKIEKSTNPHQGQVPGQVVSATENPAPAAGESATAKDKPVRRPSNRKTASVGNVRKQKKRKRTNLNKGRRGTRAILKRGYYIIDTADGKKQVPLDAADREYLLAKVASLNLQIKKIDREIKDCTHTFKSRSRRAKEAYRRDLKKVQDQERLKRESKKVLDKVEKVLTEETISAFPELSAIVTGDESAQNDYTELEEFFSVNLADEFNKFSNDPKLVKEIFSETVKYVKEIS